MRKRKKRHRIAAPFPTLQDQPLFQLQPLFPRRTHSLRRVSRHVAHRYPFVVRWKGFGSGFDKWEPKEGLSNCKGVLKDFVTKGYKKKLLALPGDANFVCGGPLCQGVSGYKRYRNPKSLLEYEKNKQLLVFMNIINFLKPKYVLMENVVDMLKYSEGYLGRYCIGCLVAMNYQSRLGMMAAGSYGLPQFRMRVFLWGALPTEKLPPYPLPTHEVESRCSRLNEFCRNCSSS